MATFRWARALKVIVAGLTSIIYSRQQQYIFSHTISKEVHVLDVVWLKLFSFMESISPTSYNQAFEV